MANVPRHHYQPSETQRAELKAVALRMRQRREQRRREAKALQAFLRIGFDDKAAAELAAIQARVEVMA